MHIGFIMNGNRRWAKQKFLPKVVGHTRGGETLEKMIELCLKEKMEYVSAWVLAKKNVENRPQDELKDIYSLITKKIPPLVDKLIKSSIRFDVVGDMSLIPEEPKKVLEESKERTKNGTKMTFILAIAYGGQDEIIRGIKEFLKNGGEIDKLNEKEFLKYLDSGRFPSPDLIIRTGGETRHSGYFLYSSEYSEYYFTDKYWPDFNEEDFHKALDFYNKVERNFGK